MRIKICGLFRDEDIDFINEARPDYAGFVFAKSPGQVSVPLAQYLRFRLVNDIIPVGIFANAPIKEIAELYRNGIISIAQLHGDEDESYISALKKTSAGANPAVKPVSVIKVIKTDVLKNTEARSLNSKISGIAAFADYLLIDSGADSDKSFNRKTLNKIKFPKPWFLSGSININNIKQAMELNPFAIDISSGAETNGIKDRSKILNLVAAAKGFAAKLQEH